MQRLSDLVLEVRVALRSLGRRRVFSLFAIASLAAGIASVIAVYSIIDAVDFHALPYHQPEQLLAVHSLQPAESRCPSCLGLIRLGTFNRLRQSLTSFRSMAAFQGIFAQRLVANEREHLSLGQASANLPQLLGVTPVLGRFFTTDEETPGRDQVIVLSHEYWENHFGGRKNALGQVVRVTGVHPMSPDPEARVVIGVMGPAFELPPRMDGWVPLNTTTAGPAARQSVGVVARLREGVALAHVRAELTQAALRESADSPSDAGTRFTAVPLHDSLVYRAQLGSARFALLGVAACLLLFALANLTALVAAQRQTRQRELAIRAALGATTRTLAVQPALELLILVLVGGAAGLWLASSVAPVLAQRLDIAAAGTSVALNSGVVAVTTLVIMSAFVVLSVVPLRFISRLSMVGTLDTLHETRPARDLRTQTIILAVEIVAAFVFVATGGLLVHEVRYISHRAPGYDPEGLAYVELPRDASRMVPIDRIVDAVRTELRTPTVAVQGNDFSTEYRLPSDDSALSRAVLPFRMVISTAYVQTVGLRMLEGRSFSSDDRTGTAGVAIVNESAARRLWPGVSAIGQRLTASPAEGGTRSVTVVGVVQNSKVFVKLDGPYPPTLYRPASQVTAQPSFLFVRSGSAYAQLASGIRSASERLFETPLGVTDVRFMTQYLHRQVETDLFNSRAMILVSILVLLLAALGVYGLAMHAVVSRSRDLGIRMALGAGRLDLMSVVVGKLMATTLVGLLLGIAFFLGLDRIIRAAFLVTAPRSVIVPAMGALVILVAAALGLAAPMVRVSRLDPARALRDSG